jgi:hypothetical protein
VSDSDVVIINGHALLVTDVGDEGRVVCGQCHAERLLFSQFTWPCPMRRSGSDDQGRSWHFTAVIIGPHAKVSVRHGVEGQRALCGTLTVDVDTWPQMRAALETLGDVAEREA